MLFNIVASNARFDHTLTAEASDKRFLFCNCTLHTRSVMGNKYIALQRRRAVLQVQEINSLE